MHDCFNCYYSKFGRFSVDTSELSKLYAVSSAGESEEQVAGLFGSAGLACRALPKFPCSLATPGEEHLNQC
jgi:hypothetical protein